MALTINESWEILFDRHRITEQVAHYGSFRISAHQINTVREARLMAKFDVKQSLPAIFRTHHLSILPISRGEYIIGPFETYQQLAYDVYPAPQPLHIPALDTLDSMDIHSEAEALRVLQLSGALHDVFASTTVFPTLQGRRGSGKFAFHIACGQHTSQTITVDNAQIEIDAAFETASHVFICESKNILVHDLLIRQLYYPYRFVTQKTMKHVVPVSIIYNNYTYYVTQYQFTDAYHYNSLVATRHDAYTLDTHVFRMADVRIIWQQSQPRHITGIPFPQADDMRIIINIMQLLEQQQHTKAHITTSLGYDKRQTDYYVNAARWLGFVDAHLQLSPTGKLVVTAPPHRQKSLIVQAMFATPLFYEMGQILVTQHRVPERTEIVEAMNIHPVLHQQISGDTRIRRAQTVQAWLRWILHAVSTD